MDYKKLLEEYHGDVSNEHAQQIINLLNKDNKDNKESCLLKAYSNDILGNNNEAQKFYEQAYKLGIPESEKIKWYLSYGSLLRENHDYDKSLNILKRGFEKYCNKELQLSMDLTIKKMKVNNTEDKKPKISTSKNKNKLGTIDFSKPSIELKRYTKIFKKFVATKDVTFSVGHGVIHGFIGPNGSGKTTTIKAMIGAYISKKGQVTINGHNAGTAKANSLIGYIPERASFPKHLNCIDYLVTMGELSGLHVKYAKQKAIDILKDLGLETHGKRKPITFSSGMQKKILLAQALITDPDILILDEPAANLDPTARKELFDELIKLRVKGKTILLSSHILAELERLINEVTFIYMGKIIFSGPISKIEEGKADVFIKTSDNMLVSRCIRRKFPKYKVVGDIKTEIVVKDLSSIEAKEIFKAIASLPDITIKSLRANDLQSIYDKLVTEAELERRVEESKARAELRELRNRSIASKIKKSQKKQETKNSNQPKNIEKEVETKNPNQPKNMEKEVEAISDINKKFISPSPVIAQIPDEKEIKKTHLNKKIIIKKPSITSATNAPKSKRYIIQKSKTHKGWELRRGHAKKATFTALTKKEVQLFYSKKLKGAKNTILMEKFSDGKIQKTHKTKKTTIKRGK